MDYRPESRDSTIFSNPIYTAQFGQQQMVDVITITTEPEADEQLLANQSPEKSMKTFIPESEA